MVLYRPWVESASLLAEGLALWVLFFLVLLPYPANLQAWDYLYFYLDCRKSWSFTYFLELHVPYSFMDMPDNFLILTEFDDQRKNWKKH